MNKLTEQLPLMLFGEELKESLTSLPDYRSDYRKLFPVQRILQLNDIYTIFIPQTMAFEIYGKLYMMATLSLKQKESINVVKQKNQNWRMAQGLAYSGVITGASSATIIGNSGVGKTTCIQKSIPLLGSIIRTKEPFNHVIPVICVTCPFDSNYKGLLCQILIAIDEALGSDYYEKTSKSKYTAQQMMALVCQLCLLHVGVLIIDEIQFIVEHKSGTQLYRMILQLINSSGISVVLVGTNECQSYFMQAPQMARRTTGMRYQELSYGSEFRMLAETLFRYQYVKHETTFTEGINSWLYEHTAGNPATLMALIHDAQEIAIHSGTEKLDITSLTKAFSSRMEMLRPYIEANKIKLPQTSKRKKQDIDLPVNVSLDNPDVSITELAQKAKAGGGDIVSFIRAELSVEEVAL